MYGYTNAKRVSRLEESLKAEREMAGDFEEIAKKQEEYMKKLIKERDALREQSSEKTGREKRNLMRELENITRYDGTDRGQQSYEE